MYLKQDKMGENKKTNYSASPVHKRLNALLKDAWGFHELLELGRSLPPVFHWPTRDFSSPFQPRKKYFLPLNNLLIDESLQPLTHDNRHCWDNAIVPRWFSPFLAEYLWQLNKWFICNLLEIETTCSWCGHNINVADDVWQRKFRH